MNKCFYGSRVWRIGVHLWWVVRQESYELRRSCVFSRLCGSSKQSKWWSEIHLDFEFLITDLGQPGHPNLTVLQNGGGLWCDLSWVGSIQDSKASIRGNVFCAFIRVYLLSGQDFKCCNTGGRYSILRIKKCRCKCMTLYTWCDTSNENKIWSWFWVCLTCWCSSIKALGQKYVGFCF